jgi:hypothetical protein
MKESDILGVIEMGAAEGGKSKKKAA